MAQHHPKIVLLKEKMIGQAGAAEGTLKAASIKRESVQDGISVMATDFVPTVQSVTEVPEAGFFAAELTDSEAENLAKNPNVEEVIDNEMQYAYPADSPRDDLLVTEEEEISEDFDEALLEHDEAELRALEEELDPALAAPADEPTAEEKGLVIGAEPAITEEDIAIEHALLDLTEDSTALLPPTFQEPTLVLPAIRGLYRALKEQQRTIEEVRDEELETILRDRGLLVPAVLRRDIILPNIRQIYANLAWRLSMGAGARVAIVDTGISPHPDLLIRGGVSYVPGVRSWRDDHGHGTHVAGTTAALLNGRGIVGVAPKARIYAVKVLSRNGSGRLSDILNGLVWCYRHRMHVVNLSLGSAANTHDRRVYNKAYERVGNVLRRGRGILLVAAAGNGQMKPVSNPARCPSFMAVSAVDGRRRFASFSNIGPQVEICAPGVSILSTVPRGYKRMSGTSMAAPHVTGTAALAKSRHPVWHGDVIRNTMKATAIDLGRPGHDWFFGAGQVNAYRSTAR